MCQHCGTDDESVPCRSCKLCSPPEGRDLRAEVLAWIDAREKECEGAMPGPWVHNYSFGILSTGEKRMVVTRALNTFIQPADASFIASARTALPLALKALRQEAEEHTPERSSEGRERCSECDWDWQQNSCPALRRLHTALLGESNG